MSRHKTPFLQKLRKSKRAWLDVKRKKRGVIMYKMLLDDLLKALENNGIYTSKLNIIDDYVYPTITL